MKNVAIALSLTAAVAAAMTGMKLSPQLAERTKIMMDTMAPFINDELVVGEVMMSVTEVFTKDPTAVIRDSVVVDGLVYSTIEDPDGTVIKKLMEELVDHLVEVGPEGAATIAAISMVTGTELLNNHV
jgi:hypothetical protein